MEEQAVRDATATYSVKTGAVSAEDVLPGYKRTEVGVIPEDWSIAQLKDLVEFLDSQRRPVKASDRAKMTGIYPYYGASGIVDYVNDYLFDEDLILLGEDGENILSRNLPLAFQVSGKIWVNNHAHVLRPSRRTDIVFLTEYLEAQDYSERNSGTAQPKLNRATCAKIPIALPAIQEQRAIATALSDADALIESLNRLIAKKSAIKQAAMQQLLTGQTRLPGFTGEWKAKRLGEIGTFYKGQGIRRDDVSDEGVPCIRYGEIYTRYSDCVIAPESRISESVCESAFPLRSGDILFAGSGETAEEIGMCVAYLGEQPAFAGGDIVVLRPNGGISAYLGRLLNHPTIAQQKARLGQGDAVVHISARNLAQIEVHLPNPEEQTAIATILSDMDTEIETLEHRRDKARQIKQGMMQQLLTGRVRLVAPHITEPVAC